MAKAVISVNKASEVWGHGDERLDGMVYFIGGKFHYDTFRGKSARAVKLQSALNEVAQLLGYTSAHLLSAAEQS